MLRLVSLVIVALALMLGGAGCGGDDNESATTETTTEETTTGTTEETTTEMGTEAGREVFVGNCGSCHTLSDAGTSGQVGPNLDAAGLDASAVENQVRNGGGGMPAFEGQLSDDEIAQVAAYVAANDGS